MAALSLFLHRISVVRVYLHIAATTADSSGRDPCHLAQPRHDRCDVISDCDFNLHSLMISDIEHLFIRLLAICMSDLFGEMSNEVFCPFLIGLFGFLVLSFVSSL